MSLDLIYTVSQKTVQNCFCQNFVNFSPILIIFGRKIAKTPKFCEVHSFSTSSNSRHHSLPVQLRNPGISRLGDSWRDIFLVNHERGALWLLDMWRLRKPLTYLLTYYRVKCRFFKLLHNAAVVISIRLLTFASSIPQRAPRDLVSLWD